MLTIHNLQQHDNLEIYKKAFNIMDKYFPDDEDVDAGISVPNVDASGAFAVRIINLLENYVKIDPNPRSSTKRGRLPHLVDSASGSSRLWTVFFIDSLYLFPRPSSPSSLLCSPLSYMNFLQSQSCRMPN